MPGYTRQMLSLVNAKVDMNNRFQLLMHQVYDCLLLFQTSFYIVTAPELMNVPSKIRVELIWESSSQEKHVCFSRLLEAEAGIPSCEIVLRSTRSAYILTTC